MLQLAHTFHPLVTTISQHAREELQKGDRPVLRKWYPTSNTSTSYLIGCSLVHKRNMKGNRVILRYGDELITTSPQLLQQCIIVSILTRCHCVVFPLPPSLPSLKHMWNCGNENHPGAPSSSLSNTSGPPSASINPCELSSRTPCPTVSRIILNRTYSAPINKHGEQYITIPIGNITASKVRFRPPQFPPFHNLKDPLVRCPYPKLNRKVMMSAPITTRLRNRDYISSQEPESSTKPRTCNSRLYFCRATFLNCSNRSSNKTSTTMITVGKSVFTAVPSSMAQSRHVFIFIQRFQQTSGTLVIHKNWLFQVSRQRD